MDSNFQIENIVCSNLTHVRLIKSLNREFHSGFVCNTNDPRLAKHKEIFD